MLKKYFALFIAAMLLFVCSGAKASANFGGDALGTDIFAAGEAAAALLADSRTGRSLKAVNEDKTLPVAGLARLPALLIICDAFDSGALTDETVVSISEEAAHIRGTTAFLKAGEQMNAYDLMMAAVMINAGDAVHALACAASGTAQSAAEHINKRLRALGTAAVYNGSDICGENIELSCSDLAKIGIELLKSRTYNRFGTKFFETITHNTGAEPTELANPNKLVKQYSGCTGIATGSSDAAGYCGVFSAARGNTSYISVVIGAKNSKIRFRVGSDLLNSGFAAFRSIALAKKGEVIGKIQIYGSLVTEADMIVSDDVYALIEISNAHYKAIEELPEYLEAPVDEGGLIGKIRYVDEEGKQIGEAAIISSRAAGRAGFFDYMKLIISFWLKFI